MQKHHPHQGKKKSTPQTQVDSKNQNSFNVLHDLNLHELDNSQGEVVPTLHVADQQTPNIQLETEAPVHQVNLVATSETKIQ